MARASEEDGLGIFEEQKDHVTGAECGPGHKVRRARWAGQITWYGLGISFQKQGEFPAGRPFG